MWGAQDEVCSKIQGARRLNNAWRLNTTILDARLKRVCKHFTWNAPENQILPRCLHTYCWTQRQYLAVAHLSVFATCSHPGHNVL